MNPLNNNTAILFTTPQLQNNASLLAVVPYSENLCALFVDKTPFHPVDHTWPDQPGDRGSFLIGDKALTIIDSVTAAIQTGNEKIYFNQDIPIKRFDDGWTFLVAHIVEENEAPLQALLGGSGLLTVDAIYRQSLSVAHSLCHLSALALNLVLHDYWKKDVITDGLGHFDFDKLAIQSSTIYPFMSRDHYRLGKSLKKKGFDRERTIASISEISKAIQTKINAWLSHGISITQSAEANTLNAKRFWHASIDNQTVIIPCGGTHVNKLKNIDVHTELIWDAKAPEELMLTNKVTTQP